MHRPQVSQAPGIGSQQASSPEIVFGLPGNLAVMTRPRPSRQTTCVTERRSLMRAIDLTLGGSGWMDMTTRSASGGPAWTSTKRHAFKNCDSANIIGTSASGLVSVGEQFQFPMPGNGWATVDYVP